MNVLRDQEGLLAAELIIQLLTETSLSLTDPAPLGDDVSISVVSIILKRRTMK